MRNWKYLLALVPFGLVLGYAGGRIVDPGTVRTEFRSAAFALGGERGAAEPPAHSRFDGFPEDPAPYGYTSAAPPSAEGGYWTAGLDEAGRYARESTANAGLPDPADAPHSYFGPARQDAAPSPSADPGPAAQAAGERAAAAARDAEAAMADGN